MYGALLELLDVGIKFIIAIVLICIPVFVINVFLNGGTNVRYFIGAIIAELLILTFGVPFLIRKFAPKDKQQAILDWYFWRNR
ncbi:hypothetical protein E5343_01340 [Rodentibacter caecimuris]|uniref:hypothetical protein n=1 Tax=Rodentibacter caecimuris TaxID=1796644 RepID=UPI00109478CC|nr:hypothetical protein [Pasteurella caecimuris]MCR1838456.1 hypothetical protein [Pasteurella caecimuris]MCU0107748.1 hypothetical protein [Pasteurella caecimuris]TGY51015.1 hypothetical protein E5343_01340 [Pasteurella caecimuris]